MAQAQLHLIPTEDKPWQLDRTTVAVGRAGLAQARAALASAGGSAARRAGTPDEHSLAA